MVLIRNQFYPGPVLHRHVAAEPLVDDAPARAVRRPLNDAAKASLAVKRRNAGLLAVYDPTALLRRIEAACAKRGWPRGKFAARIGQSGLFWSKLQEQRIRVETFAKIEALLAAIEVRG